MLRGRPTQQISQIILPTPRLRDENIIIINIMKITNIL